MRMLQNINVILKKLQATEGSHEILRYAQNDNKIMRQSILQWFGNISSWIASSALPPRNDGGKQSGNAVLFILLGVALFGALAYTFMRGSQSGQGNLTANQARIAAQEIIDYAQSIERAVNKLRQRGCSESELDIQNTAWLRVNGTPPYTPTDNPGARPDGTCALFLPTGANMKAMTIPLNYTDLKGATLSPTSFAPGSYIVGVLDIPWLTQGTNNVDIALHAIFLSDQICLKINEILGVPNNGNAPPSGDAVGGTRYTSNNLGSSHTILDISGQITGKQAFCVQGVSTQNRLIYPLLVR